ncbi:TetR/AcrR family transcriptional regulator [Chitinimonas sp.]|uniref:TetR/AcrR family transcriptional regulator n=1 Tax=Chitinimonas sp. TaxID=1934313 RepID=UPI0035B2BEB2
MDTRTALLDHATELVRTRGYSGFSYADLAERVAIRKASIHHHFPSKDDLGLALLERYHERFEASLLQIATDHASAPARLRGFAALYRDSLVHKLGCLCGMLAADVDVISPEMAAGVGRFMRMNQQWLEQVIMQGQQQGSLPVQISAAAVAGLLLSVCQGGLLIGRAWQSVDDFDRAVAALWALLQLPD